MKSNNSRRASDQATVTFSLPKDLLAKIDEAAKADSRTRSNLIVHILRQEIEAYSLASTEPPLISASELAAKAAEKLSRTRRVPPVEAHPKTPHKAKA